MARTGKKTKRRSRSVLLTVTVVTFLVSFVLFCSAAFFCKTYQNNLTAKMQTLEAQVESIQTANEETQKEVDTLASNKRVFAMAESSLTYQGQNIQSVDENK